MVDWLGLGNYGANLSTMGIPVEGTDWERYGLEHRLMNRLGPISNIRELSMEQLREMEANYLAPVASLKPL